MFQYLAVPDARHISPIALGHCPCSYKIAQDPYDHTAFEFNPFPVGFLSLAIKTVSTNRLQILNGENDALEEGCISLCDMDVQSILRGKMYSMNSRSFYETMAHIINYFFRRALQ